jgi:hypothetical protein
VDLIQRQRHEGHQVAGLGVDLLLDGQALERQGDALHQTVALLANPIRINQTAQCVSPR